MGKSYLGLSANDHMLGMCSEKSLFSVTVYDEEEHVVGHACFYDYPNVQSVKTTKWVQPPVCLCLCLCTFQSTLHCPQHPSHCPLTFLWSLVPCTAPTRWEEWAQATLDEDINP